MTTSSIQDTLRDALHAIIEGKSVKRITHDLIYEGRELTDVFIVELQRRGYEPTTVGEEDCEPGETPMARFLLNPAGGLSGRRASRAAAAGSPEYSPGV